MRMEYERKKNSIYSVPLYYINQIARVCCFIPVVKHMPYAMHGQQQQQHQPRTATSTMKEITVYIEYAIGLVSTVSD